METLLSHLQHSVSLHLPRNGLLRVTRFGRSDLQLRREWILHDPACPGQQNGVAFDRDMLLLHLRFRCSCIHRLANDQRRLREARPLLRPSEGHLRLHLLCVHQPDMVRPELCLVRLARPVPLLALDT